MIRPPFESSLFSTGGSCVANSGNFPFLDNSYYWDGSVSLDGLSLLEANGSNHDPSGAITLSTNGVNIANTSGAATALSGATRISATSSFLVWVSGKPDFLTTNAGMWVNSSSIVAAPSAVSISQNATQTIFTVSDINVSGLTHSVTVANVELQDQVCAIMVKNPTGSSLTADYYIVAENGSAVSTGVLTSGGAITGLESAIGQVAFSKYTAGTGILHAAGIFKFSSVPSANALKGLLSWMHVQFKTKEARGMCPTFRGIT